MERICIFIKDYPSIENLIVSSKDIQFVSNELINQFYYPDKSTIFFGFDDNFFRILVKICDSFLVVKSLEMDEFAEMNPWLELIDTKKGFWNSIEIESKIDLIDDIEICSEFFSKLPEMILDMEYSELHFNEGNEQFYKISSDNMDFFYTILDEKAMLDNKAIKVKFPLDFTQFSRRTRIFQYSEIQEKMLIESMTKEKKYLSHKYPEIHKKKYRYIVIFNQNVFGLSLSNAKVVENEKICKNEIEIEFWSRIMPHSTSFNFTLIEAENWVDIITKKVLNQLLLYGADFIYPGERKYDWFQRRFLSENK